jgi:hypothetical protein
MLMDTVYPSKTFKLTSQIATNILIYSVTYNAVSAQSPKYLIMRLSVTRLWHNKEWHNYAIGLAKQLTRMPLGTVVFNTPCADR